MSSPCAPKPPATPATSNLDIWYDGPYPRRAQAARVAAQARQLAAPRKVCALPADIERRPVTVRTHLPATNSTSAQQVRSASGRCPVHAVRLGETAP